MTVDQGLLVASWLRIGSGCNLGCNQNACIHMHSACSPHHSSMYNNKQSDTFCLCLQYAECIEAGVGFTFNVS